MLRELAEKRDPEFIPKKVSTVPTDVPRFKLNDLLAIPIDAPCKDSIRHIIEARFERMPIGEIIEQYILKGDLGHCELLFAAIEEREEQVTIEQLRAISRTTRCVDHHGANLTMLALVITHFSEIDQNLIAGLAQSWAFLKNLESVIDAKTMSRPLNISEMMLVDADFWPK